MSLGNWIAVAAVAAALLSNAVTWVVATYVQWRQDRREKRQRVHASAKKALLAAQRLAATTAPLGGAAWVADKDRSAEDRQRFYDMLGDLLRDLQDATVDLTLEGITGPVDQVGEMVRHFDDFRFWRDRASTATEVRGHLDAVSNIVNELRQELPRILDEVVPDRPWWRRSGR